MSATTSKNGPSFILDIRQHLITEVVHVYEQQKRSTSMSEGYGLSENSMDIQHEQ